MIRYQNFTKTFGSHKAVDSLTLEVRRGEVLALLGPNGSGKTTSLKAAAGLHGPDSGSVDIDDRPASDAAARTLLSYLPQKVAFPESLTGREVVEFYRRLRRVDAARVDEALRFASLNGSSKRAVGTYSGGMVQRLGLAVAVLPDAPILLLDEPTAALDPVGLSAFYELMESGRRNGRTVLFTSHQLADVERLADRVAVLVDGRLAALLTRAELTAAVGARGTMRVRIGGGSGRILERVRTIVADAELRDGELVVPGTPRVRAAVVETLHILGVPIQSLTTEEGRLDILYRELVA